MQRINGSQVGIASTSGYATEAHVRHVSEPLVAQRIEGTVKLRIWGQSLDATQPASWAIALRVISRDGKEERGVLLPLTTGRGQTFGEKPTPVLIGPLPLIPVAALKGDRFVAEIGSVGQARIEIRDDKQAWIEFSADACFENLATHLQDQRSSREVNRCIYCGLVGKGLSREHIIPEGLNGELTLVAASCQACGNITSAFELDVLRNAVGALRQALKMRSKRSKNRKTHFPMRVRRGDAQIEIQVPLEEYPTVLAFPVFAPPGNIVGRPDSESLTIVHVQPTQLSGLPLNVLQKKYGVDADYLGVTITYQPFNFARTIAKIAYGFAVLRLGLANIPEPYVLPVILGEEKRIGRWVGCDQTQPLKRSHGLHEIGIYIEGGEIHVLVRLFAQFGAPEYHVVVGKVP